MQAYPYAILLQTKGNVYSFICKKKKLKKNTNDEKDDVYKQVVDEDKNKFVKRHWRLPILELCM